MKKKVGLFVSGISAYWFYNIQYSSKESNQSGLTGLFNFMNLPVPVFANSPKQGITASASDPEESGLLEIEGASAISNDGNDLIVRREQFRAEDHIVNASESHPLWTQLKTLGYPSFDTVKIYGNFANSYCTEKHLPRFSFEHLTKNILTQSKKNDWPKRPNFFGDPTLPVIHRVSEEEFKKQKKLHKQEYTLGHMAAANNHKMTYESYKMTFIMTNMAPQVRGLNQGLWARLEDFAQELTLSYRNVYVFTGPIVLQGCSSDFLDVAEGLNGHLIDELIKSGYVVSQNSKELSFQEQESVPCSSSSASLSLQELKDLFTKMSQTYLDSHQHTSSNLVLINRIGKPGKQIVVPSAFFKILVCETLEGGVYDIWVYNVPNRVSLPSVPVNEELKTCESDVATISRLTGLNFFKTQDVPTINFRNCNGFPCPEPIQFGKNDQNGKKKNTKTNSSKTSSSHSRGPIPIIRSTETNQVAASPNSDNNNLVKTVTLTEQAPDSNNSTVAESPTENCDTEQTVTVENLPNTPDI